MGQPEPVIPPPTETAADRRPSLRARLTGALGAGVLRLQAATWRSRCEGLAELDRRIAAGEPCLVVFWHGKYLPLFALLRGRQACVFTSLSARGDVIAEICRRFGYRAVQIPDQGRERSLEIMRGALRRSAVGAIAVDGPLGPYHAVKRGSIQLASELRWAIVPTSVAASRQRVVASRWDRMEIPRLFTRVHLLVGDPLTVPADLTREGLEEWKPRIRAALDALDVAAAERVAALAETGSRHQP